MKFIDLDVIKVWKEIIKIEFDGFNLKIGSKIVLLEG